MNSEPTRPPALAIWLLRHLCSSRDHEALTGDLLERFGEGESGRWFWRQVLIAMLVGVSREFRAHWPQIFFSAVGAPVLWFYGGRTVGVMLANPIVARAWDWGAGLEWPMSAVFDLGFRSAIVALMVQPILAALLLLDREFRWVRLVRTLLVSLPLIAATALLWELWAAPRVAISSAESISWVSLILSSLLISAWVGCRTASESTMSGDPVLRAARIVATALTTAYLWQTIAGGNGSWRVLDPLNRRLAHVVGMRWTIPLEVLIVSAAFGWIVVRLKRRRHRMMLVVPLISWAIVFGYPTFSYWAKLAADSTDHPWFRSYLADYIARFLSGIVGTLLGGLWSSHNKSDSSVTPNADKPLPIS